MFCKHMSCMRWQLYLMRFDSPGQLWGQENVFLLCRVIDINQHSTLNIRQVQIIVDVCSTALLCPMGTIRIFISRLTAYLQGVFVPRTELNYICEVIGEVNIGLVSSKLTWK